MIIIIITIIIISSNTGIYFVVLLNCLYLSPQISTFVHLSSLSHWGGKGGESEWLSSAYLPAARQRYDIH